MPEMTVVLIGGAAVLLIGVLMILLARRGWVLGSADGRIRAIRESLDARDRIRARLEQAHDADRILDFDESMTLLDEEMGDGWMEDARTRILRGWRI